MGLSKIFKKFKPKPKEGESQEDITDKLKLVTPSFQYMLKRAMMIQTQQMRSEMMAYTDHLRKIKREKQLIIGMSNDKLLNYFGKEHPYVKKYNEAVEAGEDIDMDFRHFVNNAMKLVEAAYKEDIKDGIDYLDAQRKERKIIGKMTDEQLFARLGEDHEYVTTYKEFKRQADEEEGNLASEGSDKGDRDSDSSDVPAAHDDNERSPGSTGERLPQEAESDSVRDKKASKKHRRSRSAGKSEKLDGSNVATPFSKKKGG